VAEKEGGSEVSRTRTILLAAFLFLLAAAPRGVVARAEEAKEEEGVRFSLADVLRTALENNLDLVIARKDPRIAELNVDLAKAMFDPELDANYTHARSKGEESLRVRQFGNSVELISSGSSSITDSAAVSWAQTLDFGARYTVGLDSTRRDSLPLFGQSFNPSISSGLTFNWAMPLLKGFGREFQTENLVIAKRGVEISDEDLRRQAQITLESVEDAYWDLVAAREALVVAKESLKLAQDLHDLNRKKVEVGTLAPIEITQAEAGVASREEGVIVAEMGLRNAEDNLRRLMAVPKGDPTWDRAILPVDRPTFEPRSPDLDNSMAKAMESRSELKGARLDLQNKQLAERVARSAVRPQLDLTAAITPSGNNLLGQQVYDYPNPSPPPDTLKATRDIPGGWSDSVTEIPKFHNYDWSVALVFKQPIGNRQAKANYAIASVNREKSDLTLQNVEQTVRVDVRTAVRAVESGAKRVAAARANAVLQQKTVEAEQKKFENGMSTSFEVLRIQTDLSSARLAEIQAVTDYNKALAALERVQGTLLEARGLSLGTRNTR
jgi:outer membrane protein